METVREIAERIAEHHRADVDGNCDCEDAIMARAIVEIDKALPDSCSTRSPIRRIAAILYTEAPDA